MTGLASFHLIKVADGHALAAMTAMATDRQALRRVDGLRFARLLGTGRGDRTAPGADLRRWAMVATWRDRGAYERFLSDGHVAQRWRRRAAESYHLTMAPAGGHGAWGGHDLLAVGPRTDPGAGPVAALTRAVVHGRSWRRFRELGPDVDRELHASPGLLAVVGVGEAPVGLQATFSLWTDLDAMRRFAARTPAHLAAVRRTRSEGWYGEELFSRWVPLESRGTWDGRDPLAGRLDHR